MKIDGNMSYTPCRKAVREIKLAPEASVNLKQWISAEAFLALPPTLQKLYAQTIVDRYRVGVGVIALAWGKSDTWLREVFKELGISTPPGTRRADKERFMEFVRVGHEVPAEDK